MVDLIQVEVAYASAERQEIITINIEVGGDIEEAIMLSGILQRFPEIDLTQQSVGVFSKKRALTDELKAGDRVEIYRPLTIDPKDARRARANNK